MNSNIFVIIVPMSRENENSVKFGVWHDAERLFDLDDDEVTKVESNFNYGIMFLFLAVFGFFITVAIIFLLKNTLCKNRKWIFDALPSVEELKERDEEYSEERKKEKEREKEAKEAANELLKFVDFPKDKKKKKLKKTRTMYKGKTFEVEQII